MRSTGWGTSCGADDVYRSGSITVSHDGGYGALAGKALSLEPVTGCSVDTLLASRPR